MHIPNMNPLQPPLQLPLPGQSSIRLSPRPSRSLNTTLPLFQLRLTLPLTQNQEPPTAIGMPDSLTESTGFALRINGSCLPEQVDCGATANPFRVCCPGGTQCPHAYNVACCPSEANCTSTLLESPRCADRSWDLYDNNGYFCCDKDTTGFARLGNRDGCAVPGYSFHEDDKLLSVVLSAEGMSSQASRIRQNRG